MSRPLYVNLPLRIHQTQDKSFHPKGLRRFNLSLHRFELVCAVGEVATARPDHRKNGDLQTLPRCPHQFDGWCSAAITRIAA